MGRRKNNNNKIKSQVTNSNKKKNNNINPFKLISREIIHFLLIYVAHFTPYYELLVLKQNPGYGNLFIGILMLFFSYKELLGFTDSKIDTITCNSIANTFFTEQQDTFKLSSLFVASFINDNLLVLYETFILFIWFGKPLEKLFGSIRFVFFIFIIVIGENIMASIWNIILAVLFSNDDNDKEYYYTKCVVGFSGVIYILWIINCALCPENLTKVYYFKSIRSHKIINLFYIPFIHILLEMLVLKWAMKFSIFIGIYHEYYVNWPAIIFGFIVVYIMKLTGKKLLNLAHIRLFCQ